MKRRSRIAVGRHVPVAAVLTALLVAALPPAAARAREPRLTIERSALSAAVTCHGTVGPAQRSADPLRARDGLGRLPGVGPRPPAFERLGAPSASSRSRTARRPTSRTPSSTSCTPSATLSRRAAGPWRGGRQPGRTARARRAHLLAEPAPRGDRRGGRRRTLHGAHRQPAPRCAVDGCPPAIWQQAAGSQLPARARRRAVTRRPGRTAWTTVRSADRRRRPPATGPAPTSAVKGASNILIQDVCPGRRTSHLGTAVDSVTIAALADALGHRGPAKPSRLPPDVCSPVRHRSRRGADRAVPRSRRAAVRPGDRGLPRVREDRNAVMGQATDMRGDRCAIEGGGGRRSRPPRVLAAGRRPRLARGRAGLQRRLLRLRPVVGPVHPAGRPLRTRARGGGSPPRLRLPGGDGRAVRRPRGGDVHGRDGARGFVAASVDYDTLFGVAPEALDAKSECIFGAGSPASAIARLCARPSADCDRGVAAAGFSQGAFLAARGHNHDGRVRGVYAIGLNDGHARRLPGGGAPGTRRSADAAGAPPADRQRRRPVGVERRGAGDARAAERADRLGLPRHREHVSRPRRRRLVRRAARGGGGRQRRPLLLPRRRRMLVPAPVRPGMAPGPGAAPWSLAANLDWLAAQVASPGEPAPAAADRGVLRRRRPHDAGRHADRHGGRLRLGLGLALPLDRRRHVRRALDRGGGAPRSGTYTFFTQGDDGARLWVDGRLLVDDWADHGPVERSGTIELTAGRRYSIRLEYFERYWGATARLLWSSPAMPKEVVPQSALFPARRRAGEPRLTLDSTVNSRRRRRAPGEHERGEHRPGAAPSSGPGARAPGARRDWGPGPDVSGGGGRTRRPGASTRRGSAAAPRPPCAATSPRS